MSVIRVKHQTNYVVLHKEILENPEISLKAKGLWAFCMAKPDNWEFHLSQLVATLKEGEKALYSTINELIDFGYVKKAQVKDADGHWLAVDYEIYETSQSAAKLKECLPHSRNGDAVKRHAENLPLISNKTQVSNDNKKTTTSPSPSENGIAVGLLEEFGRTLKEPGQAERAAKYYLENEEELKKKAHTNPKGLCIHLVRKGVDLEKAGAKDIVQKRKAWAEKHAWAGGTGALTACKDGVEVISGSIARFIKYVSNDPFWESKGLSLNLAV